MTDFNLPERTIKTLKDYFAAKTDIDKAVIYGSRAMGNSEDASDIDIAIYTNVEKDLSGQVYTELDALSTPYMFDVTDYKHLRHQGLKEHINTQGKLFFSRADVEIPEGHCLLSIVVPDEIKWQAEKVLATENKTLQSITTQFIKDIAKNR